MSSAVENTHIFSDQTDKIGITYSHRENNFDDFEREITLSYNTGPSGLLASIISGTR